MGIEERREREKGERRELILQSAVQVYLEEVLTNSMLLYLVDRKNMDAIQEE